MVEGVCAPGIVVVEIISGRGQASQAHILERWQASPKHNAKAACTHSASKVTAGSQLIRQRRPYFRKTRASDTLAIEDSPRGIAFQPYSRNLIFKIAGSARTARAAC
jgi:hypothetical protein